MIRAGRFRLYFNGSERESSVNNTVNKTRLRYEIRSEALDDAGNSTQNTKSTQTYLKF